MSDDSKRKTGQKGDLEVKERPKQRTERPKLYKVILHNDDFTTMEFVVLILMEIFNKSRTESTQIMLHVHTKGRGVCGTFPRDVAETKVNQVGEAAKEAEHPLLCTMEPAD
jgi:ATP-dependent Clp protease adaptor protein ClpS